MASAGSIFVDLLLKDSSYRSGLNRARTETRGFANSTQSDLARVKGSFAGVVSPINNVSAALVKLSGIFAGALSVQQLIRYTDTWTQLESRLSLVVGQMGDIGQTQQQLFDIAQRTRQPLEGVYNLYTRLAQAIPEAQRAQYDLLGVTESINQALAITGEGSAQASSAILQFTQAVASGFKGSGQEINALLDSAPRLAQALQRSFGDGQTSLKQLAEKGKLDLDTILRALSGVGAEGQKLREEFSKLSPTVSQAFTQLNNAFLSFIGQNEAARQGASALGLAVQALADNLNTVATGVIAISGIILVNLVQRSLVPLAASLTTNIALTLSFNLALGRLAFGSTAAAGAMTALTAASTAFSRVVSLLGGPLVVGLAAGFFGAAEAMKALNGENTQAIQINEAVSAAIAGTTELTQQYAGASKALQQQIRAQTQEAIINYDKQLQAFQIAAQAFNEMSRFERGLGRVAGMTGLGPDIDAIEGDFARISQERNRLQSLLNNNFNSASGGGGLPSSGGDGKAKKEQDKLKALYEKNKTLITGLNQATIDYMQTVEELNTLREKGLITELEHEKSLTRLSESYNENKEQVQAWGIDLQEFGKEAAANIQDAFADFLFNPFEKGLKGMALGFVQTLQKMLANAASANLMKNLFGGSGGGLGGIVGSLFGSQSSIARSLTLGSGVQGPLPVSSFGGFFADGGQLGAGQWGIAGEDGPEIIYGGMTGKTIYPNDMKSGGGNTYYVDAKGADQGAVVRLEKALLTLAGPGVIEQRVVNAQARGAI